MQAQHTYYSLMFPLCYLPQYLNIISLIKIYWNINDFSELSIFQKQISEYLIRKHTKLTLRTIASLFNVDHSTISHNTQIAIPCMKLTNYKNVNNIIDDIELTFINN